MWKCGRCGHIWLPCAYVENKLGEAPNVCPRCKNPYWNRERIRKLVTTGQISKKDKKGRVK